MARDGNAVEYLIRSNRSSSTNERSRPSRTRQAEEVAEEQTEFDVILEGIGDKKIQVIKVVREVTSLGLKEAKELVDNAPGTTIKEQVSKEEAEQVKAKLEEQGATVGLK